MPHINSTTQGTLPKTRSHPEKQPMNDVLGNTLLIGAGPAAIQVAVILSRGWTRQLGIASRCSDHWFEFLQQYKKCGQVSVSPAKTALASLAGVAHFVRCYEQLTQINNQWDTIVLCVPADAYQEVLKRVPLQQLDNVRRVILLSSSFGSHLVVKHQFEYANRDVEVLSLSTYFAATKNMAWDNKSSALEDASKKQAISRVSVTTKARKKRIYLSTYNSPVYNMSTSNSVTYDCTALSNKSRAVSSLVDMLNSVDIEVVTLADCFSVEARSITAYVHPPLFVNAFSLAQILEKDGSPKYMYKLFPEGPITPTVMKEMVQLWKDISNIVKKLNAEPINLLKFLNDDNYPVLAQSIPRCDIENFSQYTTTKQEYLLYVRYASILIDPFSDPDEAGHYFDFSAVPFTKASYQNHRLTLPRVPVEDMRAMYVFYFLSKALQLPVVAVSQFIVRFEQWYELHCQQPIHSQSNDLIGNLRQSSQQVVDIILRSLDHKLYPIKIRNHNE
ncbi:opine metallophore biosynthesis dehydrogenase [Vibrio genomosp. F10 str. 9ZC157]|uniref:opine metallophore biosynthesis dehydrogenase n=1 Tax=Vibrio genomosp. F10 TaxID=723171 RepID=UPI000312E4CF|nr:opine metallophore biosynthesis dehydrogenase [Vibrio genomosp. F10]OEE95399.1 hypothetical protein A1QM_04975 [Vibrio genomosp. F10 str. 9ZC157]